MDSNLTNEKISETDFQTDLDTVTTSDVIIPSYSDSNSDSEDNDLDSSALNEPVSIDTDDGKFSTLQEKINQLHEGETLYLNNDYNENDLTNGINISKSIIIEGNGFKIDASSQSRIFTITDCNYIILQNIVFMNGYSNDNGGAIYLDKLSNSNFTNVSFINNHANNHGGAVYIEGETNFNNFINLTLTGNTALRGGAIYFKGNLLNNTINCNAKKNKVDNFSGAVFFTEGSVINNILTGTYIDNHADDHCAGVLYVRGNITGNIFDGYFENNSGLKETGGVFTLMGNGSNNIFKGKFYNNTARIGGVIYFYIESFNNTITGEFINNTALKSGSAIYFRGSPSNSIENATFINNKALSYSLNNSFTESGIKAELIGGNNIINAIYAYDMTNLIFKNVSYWGENSIINSDDISPVFNTSTGQSITLEIYKDSKLIHNITNITNINGICLLNYPKLDYGNYQYILYHKDSPYYTNIEKIGNISIKLETKLSLSNVKTTYNTGKYPIITLKDKNNKIIKNMKVTYIIGGKTYTKTTNNNGQIKITGLAPNTYKISIKFNGNTNYEKSSLNSKITINKAASKIIAKNKIFKLKLKAKRYAIILKNNKNQGIKNIKVRLKINRKTYTAKTNNKGQATFKLDKFAKRGIFTTLISFAGNKYYKASNKKTKIRFI